MIKHILLKVVGCILLLLSIQTYAQHLSGQFCSDFNYWSKEYLLFSETGTFRHWNTNPGDTSYGCGTYQIIDRGRQVRLIYNDSVITGRAEVQIPVFKKSENGRVKIVVHLKDTWTRFSLSSPMFAKASEAASTGKVKMMTSESLILDTVARQGKDTFIIGDPYVGFSPIVLDYAISTECTYMIPVQTHRSMLGRCEILQIQRPAKGQVTLNTARDGRKIAFTPQNPPLLHK